MANLTDADKILRNDTGKDIASKLDTIAGAIGAEDNTYSKAQSDMRFVKKEDGASGVAFDNTGTELESTNVEDVIKEIDGSLAKVATSGSYNDLLDKPSIPAAQVNSDWNSNSGVSQILNKPNLSTVATTGDYNDLNNKPSVAVIDDTTKVADKVWSSKKTYDEIVAILPTGTASGPIANFNTSLALPLVSAKFDVNASGGGGTPTTPIPIVGVSAVRLGYVNFNQLVLSPTEMDNTTKAIAQGSNIVSGHKYLFVYNCNVIDTSINTRVFLYIKENGESIVDGVSLIMLNNGQRAAIWNSNVNAVADGLVNSSNSVWVFVSGFTNLTFDSFNVIDITQAFGEKIANYLYSLPDNGLSIVKQLFTKDYYPYNAGGSIVTLDSVNGEPTSQNAVINLGGTYYGGYVEQDKDGHRKLIITDVRKDLGSILWTYRSANSCFFADISEMYPYKSSSDYAHINCEIYTFRGAVGISYTRMENNSIYVRNASDSIAVIIKDDRYNDSQSLINGVSGKYMIYQLNTPIEIDLPDCEPIITFNGDNNVYADSGDVEVAYKKSIDDAIAELQALILG